MHQENTGKTWIDFKQLRASLKFTELLAHYQVELKSKGDRASGFCPLPTHDGKRRSPSFSVDLNRGIWQCFGCHAKGNALDFAVRMEGFDPNDPKQLREGAVRIRSAFDLAKSPSAPNQRSRRPSPPPPPPKQYERTLVNAPIDFELQTLDFGHPYLRDRGFTDETIEYFGLGYCNRGMLKHRIAIPLHDPTGRLVGYAGRVTDDRLVSKENPKYRFPSDRERDGVLLEFRKSHLLYNSHQIARKSPGIIVVEGFASVWWLHQHGYKNAVALMGSDCSEAQAKLILERVDYDGRIWIMTDGDEGGKQCCLSCLNALAKHRFVRHVALEAGEQPTSCTIDELEALLSW